MYILQKWTDGCDSVCSGFAAQGLEAQDPRTADEIDNRLKVNVKIIQQRFVLKRRPVKSEGDVTAGLSH